MKKLNYLMILIVIISSTKVYGQDSLLISNKNIERLTDWSNIDTKHKKLDSFNIFEISSTARNNQGNKLDNDTRSVKKSGFNIGGVSTLDTYGSQQALLFQFDFYVSSGVSLVGSSIMEFDGNLAPFIGLNFFFTPSISNPVKGYIGIHAGVWEGLVGKVPIGVNYLAKCGFDVKSSFNIFTFNVMSSLQLALLAEMSIGWRF